VFGSFGWSGECVKVLTEHMEAIGVELVDPGVKVKNRPTHETYAACFEMGKKIGQAINAKVSA